MKPKYTPPNLHSNLICICILAANCSVNVYHICLTKKIVVQPSGAGSCLPNLYSVHSPYHCEFDSSLTQLGQLHHWGNSTTFVQVADLHK